MSKKKQKNALRKPSGSSFLESRPNQHQSRAADPDTGTLINLSKYGNKVYRIVGYRRTI